MAVDPEKSDSMFARVKEPAVIDHAARGSWRRRALDAADVQRLIADFAQRFVTIQPDAIDDTIVECLRSIAEPFQMDRAVVWQEAPTGEMALPVHCWFDHQHGPVPVPLSLGSIPALVAALSRRETTTFARIDDLADADREAFARQGYRSAVIIPMAVGDEGNGVTGLLAFGSTVAEREWAIEIVNELRVVAGIVGQALARKSHHLKLQRALEEIDRLRTRTPESPTESGTPPIATRPDPAVLRAARFRDQLATENLYLRKQVQELCTGTIIGHSEALRRVLEQVRQVAITDSTVLLLGETGTGKELLATHVHEMSARRGRVMVRVNCAAIPSTLIESELFGREKGAFTGALARQVGRFELADNSTIFLDEIGDLPQDVQVKLLRVLEERQIERLGSPRPIRVNVRIIAATHRNLEQCVAQGAFREDLFYRLNVFPIQVPPLRERAEDIPLLVWRFVDEFSRTFSKRIDEISRENLAALQQYAWPGNIRELRNFVERAMIAATDHRLSISVPTLPAQAGKSVRMVEVERDHLRSVLASARWRIRGMGGAAERLGLKPTTLETRMAKLGLVRPKH